MSEVEKAFVSDAMLEVNDCSVAECCTGTAIGECCERAGIAAAMQQRSAEITDEEITAAMGLAMGCEGVYPDALPEARRALRALFLGDTGQSKFDAALDAARTEFHERKKAQAS